jgi:hypothetical protein
MIDIDFITIQKILLNELYVYPIEKQYTSSLKKYKHGVGNKVYQLKSLKDGRLSRISRKDKYNNLILHEFNILPEVFKIERSYIKDFGSNSSIIMSYSDFIDTYGGLFATNLNIKGLRGSDTFKLVLDFDHVEFDGEGSIGFKISSKYKKRKF